MRDYEIVYIFRSTLTSEAVEEKLERYHAILTGDGQGEITAVVQWGKRQLAYPIQKQPNGHYVVAQFTARPEPLTELERTLKLEDDLLRYLVVISEGEMPLPEAIQPIATAPAEASPAAAPAESGDAPAGDEEAPADAEAGAEEAESTEESGSEADDGEAADGAEAAGGGDEGASDDGDGVEAADEAEAGDADDATPEDGGADADGEEE